MKEFNLKHSIRDWKKNLQQYQQLEPGDIEELESHLFESIDELQSSGLSEKEAFLKAASKIDSGFKEVLSQYQYSNAHHEPVSKWFSSWWIPSLLPNVLKITFRNFKRQPGYSFINITGLAIGMACCFIIYLFVQSELGYDSFHEKSDRIYRVDQTLIWSDFDGYFSSTGPGIARTLQSDFPEIETTTRVQSVVDGLITIETDDENPRFFIERRMLSADSTFFDIFSFNFLEGNAGSALGFPFSVVVTVSTSCLFYSSDAADE